MAVDFTFNGGYPSLALGAVGSASFGGTLCDQRQHVSPRWRWGHVAVDDRAGRQGVTSSGVTVGATARARILAASNTYSGGTTVSSGGTLQAGNPMALGNGGAVVNGMLDLNGNGISISTLSGGTTGTITDTLSPSGGTTTLTVSNSGNYSGLILDGANGQAVALVKSGPGVLTLGNSNSTYSGGTTVSGGTLSISSIGTTTKALPNAPNSSVGACPPTGRASAARDQLNNATLFYNGPAAGEGGPGNGKYRNFNLNSTSSTINVATGSGLSGLVIVGQVFQRHAYQDGSRHALFRRLGKRHQRYPR